ncbi:zinc-binding dehydrogenase [Phenylobacterium sp. LjRoot225]|uniref:zinc-binding dehydrogenase n=1 Tax=Phenylobacterium sp. LjRoot225 TaxID=3342285 RepID=UPI003ED05700
MKAAYLENGQIHVGEMPAPTPTKGQMLVRTHRCGLCASDAHFLCSGHEMVAKSQEFGGPYAAVDLGKRIVMGHEFVGEIVDYGPGSRRPLKVGAKVTSAPVMRQGGKTGIIGYVNELPGGFGEYMLLDEDLAMEVPADLPDDLAALIEPLAVGLEHARSGEPQPGEIPLVIGCGAIGLGVVAGLKLRGIGPIVAADFDAGRRAIAIQMGADVAVDPRELSPYDPIPDLGMKKPNLVYECVGKPGLLNQIVRGVGFGARIVMGGFCLEQEQLYVPLAQMKRLKINFACGEEQEDMELALRAIADGRIDVTPWLGARIGLSGVGEALDRMTDPASPVRTVVDPRTL